MPVSGSGYRIETIESAPFAEMSYVAWMSGSGEALVVDPGFDPGSILDLLASHQLNLSAILNTHGHVDHIAGNAALKSAFPDAPLVIGRDESALLDDPEANLSEAFGMPMRSPPADRLVVDGERLSLAGFDFVVREIPGHSPGSVVYVFDAFDPPFVFGGDVLFAGSVGRTDLGGNGPQLIAGIRSKLFELPAGTLVMPGHGPATTVGVERATNPYAGLPAGGPWS